MTTNIIIIKIQIYSNLQSLMATVYICYQVIDITQNSPYCGAWVYSSLLLVGIYLEFIIM